MAQRSLASTAGPATAACLFRITEDAEGGEHVPACHIGRLSQPRWDDISRPAERNGTGPWQLFREAAKADRIGKPEIAFGAFRLLPAQRLLLRGDDPVQLGSRAFDLLLALIERPGALLSKQELMAKVWPDVFVAEDNLKVQIAALRRALADGEAGNRYIAAVAGCGYCFVMPVVRSAGPHSSRFWPGMPERPHNLPAALTPLFGRDEAGDKVKRQLSHQRLVTLVGAGGIGNTNLNNHQPVQARDTNTNAEHLGSASTQVGIRPALPLP